MHELAPLHLTPLESRMIEPAVQIFKSMAQFDQIHNNVKMYIEACITRNNIKGDNGNVSHR